MREEVCEFRVQGMICRQCEDIICQKLLFTRGIIKVKANYFKNRVLVCYDPDMIVKEEIEKHLEESGYPVGEKGITGGAAETICAVVAILLFFLFNHMKMNPVPEVEAGISLRMIFLIGLMTGSHCIVMCGGILLSQTTDLELVRPEDARKKGFLSALYYNGGRVLTCTVLGVLFGGMGDMIAYDKSMKSLVYTLAGAAVVWIGMRMWGVIPWIRRLSAMLAPACALPVKWKRKYFNRPFIVGLLTGIMPCGASYAMWFYAASAGSAYKGGISMLFWALGTVPALLLFGAFGAWFPRKYEKWMTKCSVALILALGMKMFLKGIRMMS